MDRLGLLETYRELILQHNPVVLKQMDYFNADYPDGLADEMEISRQLNNSLILVHFRSDYPKAIMNSQKAVEKYGLGTYKKLQAHHLWIIGYCFSSLGNKNEAEKFLKQGAELALSAQPPAIVVAAQCYHSLAMNNQFSEGPAETSVHYLNKAIEQFNGIEDTALKAYCIMGLGNVLLENGQLAEALEKYNEAVPIFERKLDIANLCACYSNLGYACMLQSDFEKAFVHLSKALDIAERAANPNQLAIIYCNLGSTEYNRKNLYTAYDWYIKGYQIPAETKTLPVNKAVTKGLIDVCNALGMTEEKEKYAEELTRLV